jgi:sugar lactone lactonase YvrE
MRNRWIAAFLPAMPGAIKRGTGMIRSTLQIGSYLRVLPSLIFSACFLLTSPPAAAEFKSWVMARLSDVPEGLAVDSKGHIYSTLVNIGEVVRLEENGNYSHVAWVPSKDESGKGALLGLDFDKDDNIYVAYTAHSKLDLKRDLLDPLHPACRDATVTRSVYKIDAKTKRVTALATKAEGWPFCYPDDVAIDSSGNIYMTDLTYAGIWKISGDGKKVDLWSAHPLLNWPTKPYSGFPLGVNDLVLDKHGKNVYAVTDGDPMVLRIPINQDGTAGDPVALPTGFSALDGIELDGNGNIYVSEILLNQIWVLSPDGSQRILIATKQNAPLDNNTSLVLRGNVLCTANLGFTHARSEDADRTVVCMKGFSLPK